MQEIRKKKKYGNPNKYLSYIVLSIVLIIIGAIIFLAMFTIPATATITRVGAGTDGSYCVYDFDYYFNGVKYTGYGTDDDFTFAVGQTYTVYVHLISKNYAFKNTNILCYILSGIFFIAGILVLGITIKLHSAYKDVLKEVGDANGDGIIDENDILYSEKKKAGAADGVRAAARENEYFKKRAEIRCPYCDCIINVFDKFCEHCGASLGKDKE